MVIRGNLLSAPADILDIFLKYNLNTSDESTQSDVNRLIKDLICFREKGITRYNIYKDAKYIILFDKLENTIEEFVGWVVVFPNYYINIQVYIIPKARRKKYGRKLMTIAKRLSKEKRTVGVWNEQSRLFFSKIKGVNSY